MARVFPPQTIRGIQFTLCRRSYLLVGQLIDFKIHAHVRDLSQSGGEIDDLGLKPEVRRKFMRDNAVRIYGLEDRIQ